MSQPAMAGPVLLALTQLYLAWQRFGEIQSMASLDSVVGSAVGAVVRAIPTPSAPSGLRRSDTGRTSCLASAVTRGGGDLYWPQVEPQ